MRAISADHVHYTHDGLQFWPGQFGEAAAGWRRGGWLEPSCSTLEEDAEDMARCARASLRYLSPAITASS